MQTHPDIVLTGIPISPGLAAGSAYLFQDIFDREIRAYSIQPHQVDTEQARHQGSQRMETVNHQRSHFHR